MVQVALVSFFNMVVITGTVLQYCRLMDGLSLEFVSGFFVLGVRSGLSVIIWKMIRWFACFTCAGVLYYCVGGCGDG